MQFRFAQSEDTRLFYNALLKDSDEVCRRLNVTGFNEDHFKQSMYEASFVCELDGIIVGIVRVIGAGSSGFNYVSTFYVLPEYRRQGVGAEMLQFAEKYCQDTWNAVGIELVTIENEAMERLVYKCGFQLSGVCEKNYCINKKFYAQSRWIKLYE